MASTMNKSEIFTVYFDYCFKNVQGENGVRMEFAHDRKASFDNIKEALKYINYNKKMLFDRDNSTFYLSHRKDNKSPERSVYYSRLNGSGYIH